MPSTALSTDMAGVIMLSPNSSAAPNSPSGNSQRLLLAVFFSEVTRVVSARIPPSPSRSARKITPRYFIVTTITSDQMISDKTPSTFCGSGVRPARSAKHTGIVYSGLVPMSP